MNGHWNSLLNFHLWQVPARENSFPLLPGTLTVPVTTAQLIIHLAGGFNPSNSARAISSSPRVSAFSLYILVGWLVGLGFCLTWVFVHTAPFSQKWNFSHSGFSFSYFLIFSNTLLSVTPAGLDHSFCLSCVHHNHPHLHCNPTDPLQSHNPTSVK